MNKSDQNVREPVYRIAKLKKAYQDRCVLDIDDFNVYRGEVIAIIGPSGSGKSTLLRILNFLEQPSEGKIEFMGAVFCKENEIPLQVRRRVTTVFQNPILLNRTIRENIAFVLSLHGKQISNDQISQVLDEVGLGKLANQRARTLSAGEAQRVALARAMIIKPEAILFDEPTANLDPYNVSMIEKIIERLNHELNMTIILVTHNLFQAKRLAHRVAFLLDGRIIENDITSKIFQDPQNPKTRAFLLGDMVY